MDGFKCDRCGGTRADRTGTCASCPTPGVLEAGARGDRAWRALFGDTKDGVQRLSNLLACAIVGGIALLALAAWLTR